MQTMIELAQIVKPSLDGTLTIPFDFRKNFKLNKQSLLKMIMIGNNLVISPCDKSELKKMAGKIELYSDRQTNDILEADRNFK